MVKIREKVLTSDDFELKPDCASPKQNKLNVLNEFHNFYYEYEWLKYAFKKYMTNSCGCTCHT